MKRFNRKEKRDISVPQPQMIATYNKHMGGVDLHNNGIANYRIPTMRDMESWAVCYYHFKKCQCKCTFTVIMIDIFKKTVNLVMSS
jgi:hypothetical protein